MNNKPVLDPFWMEMWKTAQVTQAEGSTVQATATAQPGMSRVSTYKKSEKRSQFYNTTSKVPALNCPTLQHFVYIL